MRSRPNDNDETGGEGEYEWEAYDTVYPSHLLEELYETGYCCSTKHGPSGEQKTELRDLELKHAYSFRSHDTREPFSINLLLYHTISHPSHSTSDHNGQTELSLSLNLNHLQNNQLIILRPITDPRKGSTSFLYSTATYKPARSIWEVESEKTE